MGRGETGEEEGWVRGEGERVEGKLEGRCYEQLLCSSEEDHSIEMEQERIMRLRTSFCAP